MYTAAKAILMKLTENNKMESNLLEGAFNTFRVRIYNTYICIQCYCLHVCMKDVHAYTLTHTQTHSHIDRQPLKTHWQNDDVRYIWLLGSVHNSDETHLQRLVNQLLMLLLLCFPESNRCLKWSEKVDYCGPFPRSRHSQHTSPTAAATLPCIEVPCLLTSWLCVQVRIVLHI